MVIGGSLGARSLNEAVARNLPQILAKYQLIHIAGKTALILNCRAGAMSSTNMSIRS